MPWTIQTTFSFAGLEQGWTEQFYWSKANNNLNEAEGIVTPIAQKRARLLARGYSLNVIRNSIVIGLTNEKIKRVTDLTEPRLPGVEAWAPSTPNLTLMCVWQTADNTESKRQYMRGIPAGLGDEGKKPDLTFGTFLTNFNAWRQAMVALPGGWLKTTVQPTDQAVIESYTMNETSGIVTFTLKAPGLTFPNGVGFKQRVYVSLPGKSPLDGNIVVVPANATTCTTAEPIGVAPFEPGQLGIMQIRKPSLVTIAAIAQQGPPGEIHPHRIISHKTGRPSYASRGRAPARTKW